MLTPCSPHRKIVPYALRIDYTLKRIKQMERKETKRKENELIAKLTTKVEKNKKEETK